MMLKLDLKINNKKIKLDYFNYLILFFGITSNCENIFYRL